MLEAHRETHMKMITLQLPIMIEARPQQKTNNDKVL